jgi:hypothetical protein
MAMRIMFSAAVVKISNFLVGITDVHLPVEPLIAPLDGGALIAGISEKGFDRKVFVLPLYIHLNIYGRTGLRLAEWTITASRLPRISWQYAVSVL